MTALHPMPNSPLPGRQGRQGDIIVGLIKMRKEKQVKQLQLINVNLLFYGHGKQMDAHGNIIVRTHLRPQYDPCIHVIHNPYLHPVVPILHELRLLPVLIIRHTGLIPQPFCPGKADSRAEHVQPPYADAIGALYPRGFKNPAAGIVGRNDTGADRIGCQRNIVRGLDGIIIDRGAVTDGINPLFYAGIFRFRSVKNA